MKTPSRHRSPGYEPCLTTTTGPWLGAPCVAAFGAEDSFIDAWPHGANKMKWRTITPTYEPRIYEVSNQQTWCKLVERYPSKFSPDHRRHNPSSSDLASWFKGHQLYEPAWDLVAHDHDAVHLTQTAYLECAYAPIPCLDGITTVTGWGPDNTIWLKHPLQP